MYDSHTHLTSSEVKSDIKSVLERFGEAGGKGILDVAYDIPSNYEVLELNKEFNFKIPIKIYSSFGIHPEVFNPNNELDEPITSLSKCTSALKMLQDLIERNIDLVTCIGETGLDYKRLREDKSLSIERREELIELQKYSFRKHISFALKYQKPMSIHLRDIKGSDDVVIDALKLIAEVGRGRVTGSFHSYTLSKIFLEDIQSLGFKIGFNAIITYPSGKNVRDLLREIPMRNVLLESDAPYLPTQKKRRSKSSVGYGEPVDILEVATKMAEIKYISIEQVIEKSSENFLQLFE